MRPHAGQESGAAALFTATRCEETLFTRPAGEWCPFTAPVHSGTPFSCEDTPAGEWCRCKRRRPGSGWRRRRDLGESRRISAKLGGSRRSSGQARPDLGDTSAISRLHLGSISANLPHPRRRAAPATFSSSLAPTRGRRDCAEIAPRLRRDCAEIATGIAGRSRLPTPPGCEQEHGLDEALRSAEAIGRVYAFCARHFVSSLGFAARRGRAMVSLFFGTRYFFLLGAAPRRGLCQRRRPCRRRSR